MENFLSQKFFFSNTREGQAKIPFLAAKHLDRTHTFLYSLRGKKITLSAWETTRNSPLVILCSSSQPPSLFPAVFFSKLTVHWVSFRYANDFRCQTLSALKCEKVLTTLDFHHFSGVFEVELFYPEYQYWWHSGGPFVAPCCCETVIMIEQFNSSSRGVHENFTGLKSHLIAKISLMRNISI